MIRVCFVCLGNICRSPSAEGVMRHLVREAGLEHAIAVESAGTGGYHAGEPPDARARAAGRRRGIVVDGAAQQFRKQDYARFDYVMAMDARNLEDLLELLPRGASAHVALLRSFDPASPPGASVPDPYYGDSRDFDEVIELSLRACRGLLEHVRRERAL